MVERRTAEGDIFAEEWTAGQRERFIHPLADELGVRRPGLGENIDDWWAESATQAAARRKISGYAGDANIQEAMAEIWASYSGRGELATTLIQRIGEAMRAEWPSPVVPELRHLAVRRDLLADGPAALRRDVVGQVVDDAAGDVDDVLAAIARRQGFDGPPTVVSTAEFDRLAKAGAKVQYRAQAGAGDLSAADIQEQFRTGEYRAARGFFGNGYYVTDKLGQTWRATATGRPGRSSAR
jgi:hypothetical protein